jgi:Na+-driven multidrug efflux pump
MPIQGLSQGLIPIVGYNFGAQNNERVAQACKITLLTAVCIMTAGMIVFLSVPKYLLSMFDAKEQMLAIGIPALRIISVTFIPAAVTISIGYALSGMGNGIVSMVGTLIRQFIVLLPCAALFSYLFGLGGMWYAFWVSEIMAVVYAVGSFRKAYRTEIKPLTLIPKGQS